MESAPATTSTLFTRARFVMTYLWLAIAFRISAVGVRIADYYSTMAPLYYSEVAILTLVAYLSGWTFVVRSPHQIPRLIARPGSKAIRTFPLIADDIRLVFSRTHPDCDPFAVRQWRSPGEVLRIISHNGPSAAIPHRLPLDLTANHITGPLLTQGLGIVGENICAVLVEEIGRIHGDEGRIAGHFYNWRKGRMEYGRIPVEFLAVAGVEEEVELPNGTLYFVWQDLKEGMRAGVQAEMMVSEEYNPLFDSNDSAIGSASV